MLFSFFTPFSPPLLANVICLTEFSSSPFSADPHFALFPPFLLLPRFLSALFALLLEFLFSTLNLRSSLSFFVSATSGGCLFAHLARSFSLFLPLALLSLLVFFIRSISCVISSSLVFHLRCLTRLMPGVRGSGSRSVATIVERRSYNEGLYLGKRSRLPHCIEELPFSFTPCQVLRRERGATGAVSKAFYVLLPADATKVTPSQNIFALMK